MNRSDPGVVYNRHNQFGLTFSPCGEWVLVESEGQKAGCWWEGGLERGRFALVGAWWGTGFEITAVKMAVR